MAFGFDPSIILSATRTQEPTPNETLRTLADLANSGMHRQAQAASLADLARTRQREASLADIYRQGADNPEGLSSLLMRGGFGAQAFNAQDQASQMASQKAQRAKLFQEAQAAERKQVGELFYGVKDQAGWDAALQGTPEHYRGMLPAQFNPEVAQRLAALAVPAATRAQIDATAAGAKDRRAFEAAEKAKDRANRTQNAAIMAGQRIAEKETAATRGTAVPGLSVLEGAAPTSDDAKKVKAVQASVRRMRAYMREQRELLERNGGPKLVGADAVRMQQNHTKLLLEAKNIGELGALSGPDMALVESIMGDNPASLKSNAKDAVGQGRSGTALDGLEQWVNDQEQAILETYGYAPSPAAPTRAPGSMSLDEPVASDPDAKARAWLKANPNHPKAAQVRAALGEP